MTTLPFEDLERFYERLAGAIDEAGPERESLLLTKACFALARRIGNYAEVEAALLEAQRDLGK